MAVCDFCSEPDPAWVLPADDFVYGVSSSLGGWAACDVCAALVAGGDRDGLADRSLAAMGRLHILTGADEADLLEILRDLHLTFWRHRAGPPRRKK